MSIELFFERPPEALKVEEPGGLYDQLATLLGLDLRLGTRQIDLVRCRT